MDLKSLTPLAEFMDVLYTRCATELTPIEGLRWWLELRPPVLKSDGTGIIRIVGMYDPLGMHNPRLIERSCVFDSVTQGHGADLAAMTFVADYHINYFKGAVNP
jgi:hypothetical protein